MQHSTYSDSMESEDAEPPKSADQTDSRNIDSAKSTEDDEVLFTPFLFNH